MTSGAVHANRGKPPQMRHLLAAKPNRPTEPRIAYEAEIAKLLVRKQIGINLDERAQDPLRHHLRAHSAMQKKLQILSRPRRDLVCYSAGLHMPLHDRPRH